MNHKTFNIISWLLAIIVWLLLYLWTEGHIYLFERQTAPVTGRMTLITPGPAGEIAR